MYGTLDIEKYDIKAAREKLERNKRYFSIILGRYNQRELANLDTTYEKAFLQYFSKTIDKIAAKINYVETERAVKAVKARLSKQRLEETLASDEALI